MKTKSEENNAKSATREKEMLRNVQNVDTI